MVDPSLAGPHRHDGLRSCVDTNRSRSRARRSSDRQGCRSVEISGRAGGVRTGALPYSTAARTPHPYTRALPRNCSSGRHCTKARRRHFGGAVVLLHRRPSLEGDKGTQSALSVLRKRKYRTDRDADVFAKCLVDSWVPGNCRMGAGLIRASRLSA